MSSLHNQKFREIVFLLLYSRTSTHNEQSALIEMIMEQLKVAKSHVIKALAMVEKIEKSLPQVDQEIQTAVISYSFERIQTVEKAILRLSLYELIIDPKEPFKVILAEAIRLTKKFSSKAAISFVNAVLDNIYKRKQGLPIDQKSIESSLANLQNNEKQAENASQSNSSSTD